MTDNCCVCIDVLASENLAERLFTLLTAVAPALHGAGAEEAALPSWCGATEVSTSSCKRLFYRNAQSLLDFLLCGWRNIPHAQRVLQPLVLLHHTSP